MTLEFFRPSTLGNRSPVADPVGAGQPNDAPEQVRAVASGWLVELAWPPPALFDAVTTTRRGTAHIRRKSPSAALCGPYPMIALLRDCGFVIEALVEITS
jgi:hypothetical protein